MSQLTQTVARRGLCALGLIAAAGIAALPALAQPSCTSAGQWTVPGAGRIAAPEILARSARAQVVLLGEHHDNADHHRWELQTVAALAALRQKLVLGFEMFPRRVQGALDRWVASELTEEEFLQASDWSHVWGYDSAFYLPLFQFARLNRIPMVALNVERDLVHSVRTSGLASIPPEKREGISVPAPAQEAYLERLFAAYAQHPENKQSAPARTNPGFQRFVEAQLLWDRAMAQALTEASARNPDALIVGIMGSSHIDHGEGVQHQIENLGIRHIASLLPWDADADCAKLTSGLATAVFGLPLAQAAPAPQLLGIRVETAPDGVKVAEVAAGSIAETAGLRAGDVLLEVAGTSVREPAQVRAIVVRMAPGTWLPLKAKRQSEMVQLTAKFPATK
jgi:uncharacterized iron-regulated protein